MTDVSDKGIKINHDAVVLRVWYSSLGDHRKGVSIKAQLDNPLPNIYAFIQFFGEFKPFREKKWIHDHNPLANNLPYYSLGDISENKWSDIPIYDLCGIGSIIFNTLLTIVNKNRSVDPKEWRYVIQFGFMWGMISRYGTDVHQIPIKLLDAHRLECLICLLKCYYPKANFELSNAKTTYEKDTIMSGRW
ncbi:MAG: hypothetical protein ACYCSG_02765 [Thermoplasmataceae archaeon]